MTFNKQKLHDLFSILNLFEICAREKILRLNLGILNLN
jgi:hypothetical protein